MSSAGAAKPGPPPGALQFLQHGAGFARPSGQGGKAEGQRQAGDGVAQQLGQLSVVAGSDRRCWRRRPRPGAEASAVFQLWIVGPQLGGDLEQGWGHQGGEEHGSAGAGWFGAGWQGGTRGLNAEQEPPLKPATKKPRRGQGREDMQGCNQAWGGVLIGAATRLRSRRLKPKAAAAPTRGRGPGTAAGEGGPRNT